MKNNIRKLIALAMVLALLLSMSAFAAKETASEGIRLPAVLEREPAEPETPAETETPADVPTTVIGSAYVSLEQADSTLNVRAAASTDSDRLGALANGDKVSILGYDGDWTIISFGGGAGYVKSSYLSGSAPETETPVEPEATEEPAEPEAPAETGEPVETETPAETEEPAVEETEAPAESAEPSVEPSVEPTAEPEATEEVAVEDPTAGLRQITVVLHEGETSLKLYAEASEGSEVLATIGAGSILYVQDIAAEWSYAVYGDIAGYVRTDKIALFNEEATPEEEEIIRTIKVSSNVSTDTPVYAGTEITLSASLTGFDDVEYALQWQYTPDGGATVYDIDGANGMQHSFIIDDSNAHYLWRVTITIIEPVAEEIPAEEAAA